ncbi:hypothetical protein [Agrococcus baldri]|uniref:Uncharacterized protein n=1 Tax=Agrococcus baldri TaxID=153730 RepID=A0AA87RMQ5_9MICO|nr:hypothetical protein [Agrococcus baldri]GEK80892.1 hypothetical protein ABA31_22430 [Agrococcus baldri]
MSDFGGGFALLGLLPLIFWTLAAVGIAVAIVIAVRALTSIDRSLKQIVEQGVARGEGPFDLPSQP